ncbi:MAG: c-type cytochrome [Candidatus Brocadiales bacterium]
MPDTGDRLPRVPLIVAISLIFTVSVVVSLWSMKVFSPFEIKRVALPPEKPDPLREALSSMAQGLSNTQLVGKTYYAKYCMVCHGEQGRGDGFNAYNLDPRPRDLTKELPSDQELFKTISEGFIGSDGTFHCPPWDLTLGKDAINSTILYISTFAKKPPSLPPQR